MSDSAHKPAAAFVDFSPAACAEFPSDNPALHQGAVWICTWTRAYPRAVRLASATRPSELGVAAGLSSDAVALPDADSTVCAVQTPATASDTDNDVCAVQTPATASDADEDVNLWRPLAPAVLTLSAATGFTSEDPFVLGLRALVAFGEDAYEAPHGAAHPAEALVAADSDADDSGSTLAAEVEPLTLEGFLSGVSVAQSEAIAPVQPLCALDLDLDLDELSPQDTAWQDLLKGLCNFLMAEGSSRAAILLPALLQGEAVNLTRLPRTVIECLLAEGIATSSHDSVTVSPQFRARARSLHHAFGSARLDAESLSGWVAGLIHALLASSQDVATVLQQLHAAVPSLATLGKPAPALRSA